VSKESKKWLQEWNKKHHPERLKPKGKEEHNQSAEKPSNPSEQSKSNAD